MKNYKTFQTVILFAAFSSAAFTFIQTNSLKPKIILPTEIKLSAAQPGGLETAILEGNPQEEGLYVMRVKIPSGTKLLAHTHPDNRTVVVLSGTFYYCYGNKFDESKLNEIPAGTFFTEPANQPHFAFAKAGEVLLHVTGYGPSGTTELEKEKK